MNRRRVLTWFAGRWRNHQPKRAEKPHSKSAHRKMSDGPATRPITPLAVENGVGKPAAPNRVRLMPVRERESGELPSPICPCLTERSGRDLLFLLFLLSFGALWCPLVSFIVLLVLALVLEDAQNTRTRTRTGTGTMDVRLPSAPVFCLILPCSISRLSIVRPVFPALACTAATG
jgi:hypothetical protein